MPAPKVTHLPGRVLRMPWPALSAQLAASFEHRSGLADLTPEHRYFALAVLPGRIAEARSAAWWRGVILGLACGSVGGLAAGLWAASRVLG